MTTEAWYPMGKPLGVARKEKEKGAAETRRRNAEEAGQLPIFDDVS